MMLSPCGDMCISINAKPLEMLLLTEEISPIKVHGEEIYRSCKTPAPPISMLTRVASSPRSRGRVNDGNFANGLHDGCHNIDIGGAGDARAMSDALATRCFPSCLGCFVLLAKFPPSTDWNLLRSSIFLHSLLHLRSHGQTAKQMGSGGCERDV